MQHLRYLIGLSLSLAAAAPVLAQNTLTFTTSLDNTTCTVKVQGTGSGDATLDLQRSHVVKLAQLGAVSVDKAITLRVTGCPLGLSPFAYFYSPNVTSNHTLPNNLPPGSNTASGIEVSIHTGDGLRKVQIGAAPNPNATRTPGESRANVDLNGNGQLNYRARYTRTGELHPGAFSTQVNYSIHYD